MSTQHVTLWQYIFARRKVLQCVSLDLVNPAAAVLSEKPIAVTVNYKRPLLRKRGLLL